MERRNFVKASTLGTAAGLTVAAITSPAIAEASPQNQATKEAPRLAKSSFTTSDCVEIFYKDWGPKDAQPICFHHGWPTTSDD